MESEEIKIKQPEWTGERFLPWIKGATIQYEHIHRYQYILPLVKDKSVVDFACGEGYGSLILAGSAKSVTGIDISQTCIDHAKAKYKHPGLSFEVGSILNTPILPDNYADVLVCFEALEHVEDHQKTMGEIKRILKPEGILIISTPDKRIYTDQTGNKNKYHVHELYQDEFENLVSAFFSHHILRGQRLVSGSRIFNMTKDDKECGPLPVCWKESKSSYYRTDEFKAVAMYLIAVASDGILPQIPGNQTLMDTDNALLIELLESVEWLSEQYTTLSKENAELKSRLLGSQDN